VDNTVLVVLNFSALNRQGFHLGVNGTSAYLQPLVTTPMPLSFSKPDVQLCLLAARGLSQVTYDDNDDDDDDDDDNDENEKQTEEFTGGR